MPLCLYLMQVVRKWKCWYHFDNFHIQVWGRLCKDSSVNVGGSLPRARHDPVRAADRQLLGPPVQRLSPRPMELAPEDQGGDGAEVHGPAGAWGGRGGAAKPCSQPNFQAHPQQPTDRRWYALCVADGNEEIRGLHKSGQRCWRLELLEAVWSWPSKPSPDSKDSAGHSCLFLQKRTRLQHRWPCGFLQEVWSFSRNTIQSNLMQLNAT